MLQATLKVDGGYGRLLPVYLVELLAEGRGGDQLGI